MSRSIVKVLIFVFVTCVFSEAGAVRGGTVVVPNRGSVFESVGKVGGCTATLVSPYAALTAAHCVSNNSIVSFVLPNQRGTLIGNVMHHPQYENLKWLSYDYALIIFSQSVFDTPNIDAKDLKIPRIMRKQLSEGDQVRIYGFGRHGVECKLSDGKSRVALTTITHVAEDWSYTFGNENKGLCGGDSGGPLFKWSKNLSEWQIAGVNSWGGGNSESFVKSSYVAADWIAQNYRAPIFPQQSNDVCRVYMGSSIFGKSLDVVGSRNLTAEFDNATTMVWVPKGFSLSLYADVNFGNQVAEMGGYDGKECNQNGCLYDLEGSSVDNTATSAKCEQKLPENTWGDCILYDWYGDNNAPVYFSTKSNPLELGDFNNLASQIWVKRNHTAELFPDVKHKNNLGDHQSSLTYEGNNQGLLCNDFGCLHDLTGTSMENTTSSMKCN